MLTRSSSFLQNEINAVKGQNQTIILILNKFKYIRCKARCTVRKCLNYQTGDIYSKAKQKEVALQRSSELCSSLIFRGSSVAVQRSRIQTVEESREGVEESRVEISEPGSKNLNIKIFNNKL